MPIYTRTGDKGQTSLFGGGRVPKYHIRVETYGTVDELNSMIGVVLAFLEEKEQDIKNELLAIQHDLLEIGSTLSNPKAQQIAWLPQRISHFEKKIDEMTGNLPQLRNFILPGGGKTGSFLQVARTLCRRTERRLIEAIQKEDIDETIIIYFNRLSDFLFTLARFMNHNAGKQEVIWTKSSSAKATEGQAE